MGKYCLPESECGYTIGTICKMKKLQIRPYALESSLNGTSKSFKDELAVVSHFLMNKYLGLLVDYREEAELIMKELLSEKMASQGMMGEPRMAEADMFSDFFNVPFLPNKDADFTFT